MKTYQLTWDARLFVTYSVTAEAPDDWKPEKVADIFSYGGSDMDDLNILWDTQEEVDREILDEWYPEVEEI